MKTSHWRLIASFVVIGVSAATVMADPPGSQLRLELPDTNELPMEFDRNDFGDSESARIVSNPTSEVYEEKIQERYSDGKIHIERFVILDASGNFVNHGSHKEFSAKGEIVRTGAYQYGVREGQWLQIISEKQLAGLGLNLAGFQAPFTSTANFKNGLLEGEWSVSDSRKKIVFNWECTEGQRDGISLWFAANGEKLLQVEYEKNLPTGSMFVWKGKDPLKPQRIELVRGMELKTSTEYHDKSKRNKKHEMSFLVPSSMQIASQSWEQTQVQFDVDQNRDPIRHGEIKIWHPNGTLAHSGKYELGEPTDQAEWWYANGQRQTIGNYLAGKPVGQWVWWHDNGMRKMEGGYDNGIQIGLWRAWTERGQLASTEDLSDDSQVAELKFDSKDQF